jgi:hypothetical protein
MSSVIELRRLSAEPGERVSVRAADLVGRWVYFQRGLSAAVSRAYCQAQRGGRVLEMQPTARANGAPYLVCLSVVRVVLVETVEEAALAMVVDPRTEDQQRMDFLDQLHKGNALREFILRMPERHRETSLRRVLDVEIGKAGK